MPSSKYRGREPGSRSIFKTAAGEPFAPKYVNVLVDRTGILRTYYRKDLQRATIKGARLMRTGVVDAPQGWWDQYWALRHGRPLPDSDGPAVVEKGQVVPGSWDALISHFVLKNLGWLEMSKETRKGYRVYMNKIALHVGDQSVAKTVERGWIKEKIHQKQYGNPDAADPKDRRPHPGAARDLRTVFSLLCEHARVELKWISVNPVRDIKKPKLVNPDGIHTLTETEVEKLRRAFPDYASDERAFLECGISWGARANDLLKLGWRNIENGEITFRPEKTKRSTKVNVTLPVKGEHLLAVLAHRPKTDAFFFLAPPRGSNQWNRDTLISLKSWDYTRARKMWKAMREAAGISDEATIHSMRKYFATRMADRAASLQDIADALGDTEESATIYIRKRNRKAGAARAVEALLAA